MDVGTIVDKYKAQKRYIIYDEVNQLISESGERSLSCPIKSVHDLTDATLILKDLWADQQLVRKGFHVGIVGVEMDWKNEFVIDRYNGFLVLEPDFLVSTTAIASSYFCARKTVFNERMRLPLNNRYLLEGVIGHELLARGMLLKVNERKRHHMLTIAWNLARSSSIMLQAYGLGMTNKELEQLVNSLISYALSFLYERYDGNIGTRQTQEIEKVVDVEDSIWSPTFGLKGKFDATVITQNQMGQKLHAPFEIKTGNMDPTNLKGKDDHIAQVQLYLLLMNERYQNVTTGLLYYLKPDTLVECQMDRKFLQPLIIARNRFVLSQKIFNGSFLNLPKPSVSPKICEKCEHKITCSMLTRTTHVESLEEYKNQTEEALIKNLNHLSKEELDFFKAWFTVITAETEVLEKKNNTKSLWTIPTSEREKTGRCISKMMYKSHMDTRQRGYDGVYALFSRPDVDPFDFQKLEIQPQDLVIVSTDKDLCLAYGIVECVDPPNMVLRLERIVSQFVASEESRCFPVMTIDKIQSFSPMAVQYGYLQALMMENPGAARLRNYIIKKEKSNFPGIKSEEILKHGSLKGFNRNQREIIVNAIRTDSFLFVKGMPGTGKTRTIIGILKFLTKMGKSVLVTGYTGTAVDNILINCYSAKITDFIRIGQPKIRHFSIIQRTDKAIIELSNNLDDMTSTFNKTPIIATTLLNLKHEIFQVRKFDYVIVDEASQALPASVFGALLLAHKFILVGDPDQLSTIMATSTTQELNLADNFFSMMANEGNTKVLKEQYRMNSEIMKLSNHLVYNRIMVANQSNSSRCLKIQSKILGSRGDNIMEVDSDDMLQKILSTELDKAVIFLNTDHISGAREEKMESSIMNVTEARLVEYISVKFIGCGIKPQQVGVIAPYRGQVNAIQSKLKTYETVSDIEVNTVDQYQGRDKDIIICSFTKTKLKVPGSSFDFDSEIEDKKSGISILENVKRLNVALTRAKVKLILIGNKTALMTYEPMKQLFSILRKDQIHDVNSIDHI